MQVVFGVILTLLVFLAVCMAMKNLKGETWDLQTWYAIHKISRNSSMLISEIKLFPPSVLDTQAQIVLLRNALRRAIPQTAISGYAEISAMNKTVTTSRSQCLGFCQILNAMLDFNIRDLFDGDNNISLKLYYDE